MPSGLGVCRVTDGCSHEDAGGKFKVLIDKKAGSVLVVLEIP